MSEVKKLLNGIKTRQSGASIQLTLEMEVLMAEMIKAGYSSENPNPRITGRLNPSWVEIYMGFPCGWTDPGTEFIQLRMTLREERSDLPDSVTPSFRRWLSMSEDASSNSMNEREAGTCD
jgi:hypothetical protein